MKSARGIAALVGLLLGAGRVHAGDEIQTLGDLGVEVRVWSPWPESACRGWAPARIEVRNDSEQTRVVSFEGSAYDWQFNRSVQNRVELGAGERTSFELLLPLGGQWQNDWSLWARSDDWGVHFSSVTGSNAMDPAVRQVLLFSERVPAAGDVEVWEATLSAREVTEGASSLPGAAPSVTSGLTALGYVSTTPAATTPDIDLAHSRFAGLARHWGAYTSLDLVVLDVTGGAPSAAELAPLIAWVRSGGDLLVIGERAEAEARAAPEFAAWMETRFRSDSGSGDEYRCGLGRLGVGSVGGNVTDYEPWITTLLAAEGSPTYDPTRWRGTSANPQIPGLDLLPYRTFALVLMLFALVIGPVNFVFIAKKKKAVLLLVTIPAIAFVTTLLLLGYGILFQGLDVKTASTTLTLLDERAHRTSTLEVRQMFAGLAPAEGLAPDAGTVVQAVTDGALQRQHFEVEYGNGTLLKGDYLPTRIPVRQVIASEKAERARLLVRLEGGRLRVDNNLGARVESLVLRDLEGRFHALELPLAPGESAALVQDESSSDAPTRARELCMPISIVPAEPAAYEDYLPPGCYLAELATNPFRDACGIEENELAGRHVLYGVLPVEAEAWR